MAGLLDFFTSTDPAEQAARMQMAQGLLSGQGSSISRLAGGMGAYQQAMAQAKKEEEARRMREQQAQMQALQQQMLQQQMQQQQARAEAEKRAAMTQQTDEGLMRRLAGMPVEQQMPQGHVGPGMPQRNPGIDPRTFLNQGGSMGGLQQAMALSQALSPASSKPLVSKPGDIARDPTTGQMLWQNPAAEKAPNLNDLIIMGPDGKPMVNQMALQAKRELAQAGRSSVEVSYGAPVAAIGPDGKPVFFQPDRGGGAPAIIPGVSPPPRAPSGAEEKAAADKAKTGRQGEQMFAAIEAARGLLKAGPTQSGVGSGLDAAGRFVGISTESAQSAAKLETLSGWMVANVPRMEGPQSNFDVENYKTMAAKVGDRTVPVRERMAALKTLEDLHVKYADINGTPRSGKTVTRTGKDASGRKVVQYSDGSVEYAD